MVELHHQSSFHAGALRGQMQLAAVPASFPRLPPRHFQRGTYDREARRAADAKGIIRIHETQFVLKKANHFPGARGAAEARIILYIST